MTVPAARLQAAIEATWPAAAKVEAGPWTLREGRGGGKRVSAATIRDVWREDDLGAAEEAMRFMGQIPLFMIREGEGRLDAHLAARGYAEVAPVDLRLCPLSHLTDRTLPRVTAFAIWEPLAIMVEIWEDGGIGDARLRVMDRVTGPKTSIFGRVNDKPAGSGFCAVHDGIAFVHALHILEPHRGKGLGGWMMRCAALWAMRYGANWVAVLHERDNRPATALYEKLGMMKVGQYHYRMLTEDEGDDA